MASQTQLSPHLPFKMTFYCRLFLWIIFSFGKYLQLYLDNTIKFYHFWFIPSYNILQYLQPYLLTVYSGATKWVSHPRVAPVCLANLDGAYLFHTEALCIELDLHLYRYIWSLFCNQRPKSRCILIGFTINNHKVVWVQ